MQIIKHLCDICGEEFDKSNMPPWYPDYCPKHMEQHRKHLESIGQGLNSSTYTLKDFKDIKVWI